MENFNQLERPREHNIAIMQRLDQESVNINGQNYEIIARLSGGVNNGVYKVKDREDKKYSFKVYKKPNTNDERLRAESEKIFIEYMARKDIKNVPRYIKGSTINNWALLSWIEGEKVKKLEDNEIDQIGKFIIDLNKDQKVSANIKMASEALTSIDSLVESIEAKKSKINSWEAHTKEEIEVKKWVKKKLWPLTVEKLNILDQKRICRHWEIDPKERIASPSDIGIHNMLKKNEQLFFIDFEYAGFDDLSKLLNDLIQQPEYRLDTRQEIRLMKFVEGIKQTKGNNWKRRYEDIRELTIIKWTLIILNSGKSTGKDPQRTLEKAINYLEGK